MDIIFLDIDGVMVSYYSVLAAMYTPFRQKAYLDPRAMRALRRLVERTGAKIVIISSWRGCGEPYEWFKRRLRRNGTPVFGETDWLEDADHDRSDEIFHWIQGHDVRRFVVLDDNDRFENRLAVRSRWVNVDMMHGLTIKDVEKAAAILKK